MAELKRKVSLKRKGSQHPEPPLKGDNKSKYYMPILILLGLLVLGLAGYYALKTDDKDRIEIIAKGSEAVNGVDETVEKSQVGGSTADGLSNTDGIIQEDGKTVTNSSTQTDVTSQSVASTGVGDQNQTAGTSQGSGSIENSVSNQIPYKTGVAYKVYQFPFGSGDYSKSNSELDKLVEVLKQNSNIKISIEAFTDNVGSVEFNQALSEIRAKAINDYIVSKGIEKNRLSYNGRGISIKFDSDAENRRAEFKIS